MRIPAVIVASLLALAAGAPGPEKIVFARVWPNAGQIGLFVADADGANERPLVAPGAIDYDPVWSPDGASIVFTSDREGSADLVSGSIPTGPGSSASPTSPAYDDQAAFSPDGKQLVFVTTRNGGTADLWTMDMQTRRAKALTSGAGGDFRPNWSPDGKWIAFSSDRGSTMPFGYGRWEHLQLADLYLIHPDGTGLKRITAARQFLRQPEVLGRQQPRASRTAWSAEDTLEVRRPSPKPESEHAQQRPLETHLVSIDIATAARSDVPAGPGVKFNPSFVPGGEIGYIRKDVEAGVFYTSGQQGPRGDVRSAAWSPDGKRVAFHRRHGGAAHQLAEDLQPESAVRVDAHRASCRRTTPQATSS